MDDPRHRYGSVLEEILNVSVVLHGIPATGPDIHIHCGLITSDDVMARNTTKRNGLQQEVFLTLMAMRMLGGQGGGWKVAVSCSWWRATLPMLICLECNRMYITSRYLLTFPIWWLKPSTVQSDEAVPYLKGIAQNAKHLMQEHFTYEAEVARVKRELLHLWHTDK